MPQTRSRHAVDAPRPRRKAATRVQPSLRAVPEGTVWTDAAALSLVGKEISVCWPSDGTYYPALVVGFHPRKRAHKLIYLADETVESVELGTGPAQRDYRISPAPADPVVGKTLEFFPDGKDGEPSWFDFMRAPKEKPGQKFSVIVFAKIVADPDPEEVCSPLPPDGVDPKDHQYYRVIYLANEYLATVDLAQVEYVVETPPETHEDPVMEGLHDKPPAAAPQQRSALPPESQRLASRPAADQPEDDEPPEPADEDADDDAYEPAKDPEVVDESDAEVDLDDEDPAPRKALSDAYRRVKRPDVDAAGDDGDDTVADKAAKRADRKYRASGTKDLVVDAMDDGKGKAVTVDRDPGNGLFKDEPGTRVRVTPDDSMNAVSLDNTGSKVKGEGSVGTQETRDDPLDRGTSSKKGKRAPRPVPASLYPPLFEDEEDGHDTASDEEKLGWVTDEKKEPVELKSQVGDYISLDMGEGQEPRKAFVEAYLPAHDKHFVAFCDAEGGNLKIKLTRDNHTVLKDEEVHELSRTPIARDEPAAGLSRSKRRRNMLTLTDSKSKKKREGRLPPVKGATAGAEICGRCLKIVWPGSDLVYTALVLGYDPEKKEHLVVYLSDHCVETLELKYREWNLLAREDEPWIAQGMLGQRLYVLWPGEYDSKEANDRAEELFDGETKVAYEAYVLSYEGEGKYLILYPNTEDTEVRDLRLDDKEKDDLKPFEKDWDILEAGLHDVAGLPVVEWEP